MQPDNVEQKGVDCTCKLTDKNHALCPVCDKEEYEKSVEQRNIAIESAEERIKNKELISFLTSPEKPFKIDVIRDLFSQYYREEISLSRLNERLNEIVFYWNTSFIKFQTESDLIAFAKKCFYKGFEKSEKDDANCFTAWREESANIINAFYKTSPPAPQEGEADRKATELMQKFRPMCRINVEGNVMTRTDAAKQCALICVDEIMNDLIKHNSHNGTIYQFWQQVRHNILKR